MRNLTLFLILTASIGALADDVERHRHFMTDGIYDPRLSNSDAYAIVQEGIESGDPDMEYLTVASLSLVNMFMNATEMGVGEWLYAETGKGKLPERDYSEVPGLKEFLIGYWRRHHEEGGYDADFDNSDSLEDHTLDVTHVSRETAWKTSLAVLCRFYPGDPDVHALLWEVHDTDMTHPVTMRSMMLIWLNSGKFTTPEADAYRLDSLALDKDDRRRYIVPAVKGLSIMRRPEALPVMIEVWQEHPGHYSEISSAVATYPDSQLRPHAQALRDLVGGDSAYWREHATDAVIRAMSRLERVAEIDEH